MTEYMNAFEMEIAAEGLIDAIREKTSKIFTTLSTLFHQCIEFLIGLINKLRKRKGANQSSSSSLTDKDSAYDCGKELYGILGDLKFCMDMIVKRPTPNHKTNKSYKDRWAQDDQLIMDRMERCTNNLKTLESINNKTINLQAAEDLKRKFEELDAVYKKYAQIYELFANKHQESKNFMDNTHRAFIAISNVAGRAARINLTLMVPKDD